jgi:small basic protein
MWLPLLAVVIGFFAIYLFKVPLPGEYSQYVGMAVVAGFDSIVGAIHSSIEGKFNDRVFVSGFFINSAVAAGLLFVGNALNIQYVAIAIMVALFIRIFNNLGFIRRFVVARLFEKRLTAENTFPEP